MEAGDHDEIIAVFSEIQTQKNLIMFEDVLAKFGLQDTTSPSTQHTYANSDASAAQLDDTEQPHVRGNNDHKPDTPYKHTAGNKIIFAAIDFGTSFSGWAFATRTEVEKRPPSIYSKLWYSNLSPKPTVKTPTCVLMKPDGETLVDFGYGAEEKYEKLVSEGHHKDYYYFKNFKTSLYGKHNKPLNLGMTLIDQFGRNIPAINVISSSIRYLADDMFADMEKRVQYMRKDDIEWIITVPAIWTDQAKFVMRESAIKAGLSADNITMALEPEAASVYCRLLDVQVANRESGVKLSSLEIGSKYLVLDAGGGTIDLTVHEVESAQTVKQIVASGGNASGGSTVNREFEIFLIEAISDEAYQEFKQRYTDDWLYFMDDFEHKKKSFDPREQTSITLRFPPSLKDVYNNKSARNWFLKKLRKQTKFEDAVKQTSYGSKVEVRRDRILISVDIFRQFFKKSIDDTVKEIRKQLVKVRGGLVSCIVMVGGFSECKLLQETVIDTFPSIPVVVPIEASTVVLKGAVVYGHNPPVISERVVKYTYGVSTCVPFMENVHPIDKRKVTDSGVMCDDVFDKHVTRGQAVKTGEAQNKKTYRPTDKRAEYITFVICASKVPHPRYTTDKNCYIIGRVELDLSETADACNEDFLVYFAFGGTEIAVTAIEERTGRQVKTKISSLEQT